MSVVRRRPGRWISSRIPAVATAVILLLGLEALSRANTRLVPEKLLPPPTSIFTALIGVLPSSALRDAVGHTLAAWALGLSIATVAAVLVGVVVGSSRWLYESTRSSVELLRPIPALAFYPLVILVFGLGLTMETWLIAWSAFWPLLIQMLYGMQEVDQVARDTARAYGLGRAERLLRIDLPSAAPYFATGFRLAAVIALNVAVGVELIVGTQGLGGVINAIQQSGVAFPRMYAYVVVAGVLGLVVSLILRWAEKRLLHWHASQRRAVPV